MSKNSGVNINGLDFPYTPGELEKKELDDLLRTTNVHPEMIEIHNLQKDTADRKMFGRIQETLVNTLCCLNVGIEEINKATDISSKTNLINTNTFQKRKTQVLNIITKLFDEYSKFVEENSEYKENLKNLELRLQNFEDEIKNSGAIEEVRMTSDDGNTSTATCSGCVIMGGKRKRKRKKKNIRKTQRKSRCKGRNRKSKHKRRTRRYKK